MSARRMLPISWFLVVSILTSVSLAQAQQTYNVCINKPAASGDFDASQCAKFSGNFSVTTEHTQNGVNLTFPGVDINFRCAGTVDTAADSDACVIAVGQQVVVSGDGSTPSVPATPDVPVTTPDPVTPVTPPVISPGVDGECTESATVRCFGADFGPTAVPSGLLDQNISFPDTRNVSVPFSFTGYNNVSSQMNTAPINGREQPVAADGNRVIRVGFWFSNTPGGQILTTPSQAACGGELRSQASILWGTNSSADSTRCDLAPSGSPAFLNFSLCEMPLQTYLDQRNNPELFRCDEGAGLGLTRVANPNFAFEVDVFSP